MPGREDRAADIVAGLGEEAAVGLRFGLGEREPVAALLGQPVDAQPPEQDIVRSRVFGVQLQACTLKPLRLERLAFQRFLLLRRERQTEDCQPTVLLPEFAYTPRNAGPGLREATFILLSLRVAHAGHAQQHSHAERETNDS